MKDHMGFDELFDHCYASCTLGCAKPDPQFFLRILSDLTVGPGTIVYWDDHQANIDIAQSLGMNAYLVTNKEQLLEQIHAIYYNR